MITARPLAAPVIVFPLVSLTVIRTVVARPATPEGALAVDCPGLLVPTQVTETALELVVVVPFAEATAL
jgi:hypothetical protein